MRDVRVQAVQVLHECYVDGVAGRALGGDAAVLQRHDGVGAVAGGRQVVRDQHDGAAGGGDLADEVEDFDGVARVEGAGGLVPSSRTTGVCRARTRTDNQVSVNGPRREAGCFEPSAGH
ncbi:hypothetical protein ACWDUC_07705 [Streptomyces tricolor]